MLRDQLNLEQLGLIGVQKSAEGIVGCFRATKGPNKLWTVIMREELSDGICKTAQAVPANGRG